MYDTVILAIKQIDVPNIDLMAETSCRLHNMNLTRKDNGAQWISGDIAGMKALITEDKITIGKCSLSKWYLGNNIQTMTITDTHNAIDLLSEAFGLPIHSAKVERLDTAFNLELEHPVKHYLDHLGSLLYYSRLEQPYCLYYNSSLRKLAFYDKIKELKAKRKFSNHNLEAENMLRFEICYRKDMQKIFGKQIFARDLYNPEFYYSLVEKWTDSYFKINKRNEVDINFEQIDNVRNFNRAGRLCFCESIGGQMEMIGQINKAYKCDKISRRTADSLKQAVREAYKGSTNFVTRSPLVSELDEAIIFTASQHLRL